MKISGYGVVYFNILTFKMATPNIWRMPNIAYFVDCRLMVFTVSLIQQIPTYTS